MKISAFTFFNALAFFDTEIVCFQEGFTPCGFKLPMFLLFFVSCNLQLSLKSVLISKVAFSTFDCLSIGEILRLNLEILDKT